MVPYPAWFDPERWTPGPYREVEDGPILRCPVCYQPMQGESTIPPVREVLICPKGCKCPYDGLPLFYAHECVANAVLDVAIEAGFQPGEVQRASTVS